MDGVVSGSALDRIPDDLHEVLGRFAAGGFDVWLVGGALRDSLLGVVPKDWDLATSASPEEVMRLFPRVIPIGVRHGTVQVHTRLRSIEVTSCPAGEREGILADLKRRDFTVNALALTYPAGVLLDPCGGQEDLLAGILRAVEDAPSRFREDPLRTLRAGRFISVYGFKIEPRTFAALEEAAPGLRGVARERIREELFKMLLGKYFREGFEMLVRGHVIQEMLPEFSRVSEGEGLGFHCVPGVAHAVNTVHLSPPRIRVRLAALFHNLAEVGGPALHQDRREGKARDLESALAAEKIMQRLRASQRLTREVVSLVAQQVPKGVEAWGEGDVRRFLAKVGLDRLTDVLDLAYADLMAREDDARGLMALRGLQMRVSQEMKRRPPLRLQDLAITGRDVMNVLNLKPGPLVGELLQSLHQQVLENPAGNEPKFLMDFLRKEYNLKFNSPLGPEGKKQKQGE
jgi:tRNA nucleotidyltransferase (CCA-adding enzyme)